MTNKIFIGGLIVAIVVGVTGLFLPIAPQVQQVTPVQVGAVNDSYSAPASVSIQLDPSGATFGYDSVNNRYAWGGGGVLNNTSGRDRWISSIEHGCTGLGAVSTSTASTISLIIATSTTIASTTSINGAANTNNIYNNPNAIATSSAWYFQIGTSTPFGSVASFATGVSRIWANGSLLNVESAATSSASCWLKVNYLAE